MDDRRGWRGRHFAVIVTHVTLAADSLSAPAVPAGRTRAVRPSMASTAWIGATDALLLLAIVFAIPFVILAVGAPIALALRLLLWLLGLL